MSDYYNTAEQEHKKIVNFMFKHAIRFPKKHGEWMRFYLGGRTFISMDSHNKYIHILEGDCEYNYWLGFDRRKRIAFLGGSFGGFCKGGDFLVIRKWLKKATAITNKAK